MNNGDNSRLHTMYICKILDTIICNTHTVNCTYLLGYDVLCNQIFVLYCIILTNVIFSLT